MRFRLLAALSIALIPGVSLADPLELVCSGEGTKTEAQTTYGSARTSGGETVSGSSNTYRRVVIPAQIWLKITGDDTASMKLPRSLIPPLHSGGHESWWPLNDLQITDESIAGTFRLNFMNKGRLVVDRHTGQIEMTALGGGFSGVCKKAEPVPTERLF